MSESREKSPLLAIEREQWAVGFKALAGVDEAGRGPLAGPLVVAAVILPREVSLPPFDDSKKLSDGRRRELRDQLLELSDCHYCIIEISVEEIDRLNILRATHEGMRRALCGLPEADFALIDGLPVPGLPIPNRAVVKGDSLSLSIAAASILAKVYRDELMEQADRDFPEYGFARHKGYGTAAHMVALREYGACAIHRRSFAPVRRALGLIPVQQEFGFD